MPLSFDQVWDRILAHEGEAFAQVRGGQFTYHPKGNGLALSRTGQILPRSVVETAWSRLPVAGPGALNDLRGPSYLYAILTDDRISGVGAQAYEREKAEARLLLVDGLLQALDAWPSVTATVWAAKDRRAAHAALQTECGLHEMTVGYLLDLQLAGTTELSRSTLADEAAQLREIIAGQANPDSG